MSSFPHRSPAVAPELLPLLWCAPLAEPSGYADEARSILLALEGAGYAVGALEYAGIVDAGVSPRQRAAIQAATSRRAPAPFVSVHHYVPGPAQPVFAEGPNVARTMFETDRIPSAWGLRLLELDEIWVPCSFNVETFQRGGIPTDRVRLLPMTLDYELFDQGADPLPIAGLRGFTFLANFDFTDRKGWDLLLDGWADAFAPDDDVCLLLKCVSMHGSPGLVQERIQRYLGGRATAPIVVNTDVLPVTDLPRLYAAVDAFVLPTRGEGWGRPYMEAMAMGLPTIGSRWSGNVDFMHDGNSWLLDGRLVQVPQASQQHTHLYRGHRWFEPDREALVAALREVAAGGDAVRARAAGARADLEERFPPGRVAHRIAELTHDLLERWHARQSKPVACVWRGDFGSAHSLAVVNESNVRELEARGARIRLLSPAAAPAGDETVGIAQQWPPRFDAPAAGPFVLYQPWEFGRAPAAWIDRIRRTVDEVWTPSAAAREAYVASGVAPELVHVVPNGVDLERFSPAGERAPLATSKGTVFLFVGAPIHRKGVDLLLGAYARAFSAADDVCLVLKAFGLTTVYRGGEIASVVEAFRARPDAPELLLLDEDVPYDQVPALYRAADVVVQPYRAEGFCLPALEALACGKPVIVTAGGPTDDFVSDNAGWLVPARQVPLPAGGIPDDLALAGDGFLLEPDLDALVAVLRDAFDPAARAPRAAAARAHAEPFSWARAADAVAARLAVLSGVGPIRRVAPAVVPGRKRLLIAALPDWELRASWAEPLAAYAAAFAPDAETTLVLPTCDEAAAHSLLSAELRTLPSVADVALAAAGSLAPEALELAADAVIVTGGPVPRRARRLVPPDPDALRALLEVAA